MLKGPIMIIRVVLATAAGAVVFAPPAAATHDEYSQYLQQRLVFLSEQQLIDEGYRVCAASAGGVPAGNISMMVVDDLGVSQTAAGEIISTAVRYLC